MPKMKWSRRSTINSFAAASRKKLKCGFHSGKEKISDERVKETECMREPPMRSTWRMVTVTDCRPARQFCGLEKLLDSQRSLLDLQQRELPLFVGSAKGFWGEVI